MSYPRLFGTPGFGEFAELVDEERQHQLAQWGDQHRPNGTGEDFHVLAAEGIKQSVQRAEASGGANWRQVLMEETAEVFAENNPTALLAELVQVAAVAAAWAYDLKRTHGL